MASLYTVMKQSLLALFTVKKLDHSEGSEKKPTANIAESLRWKTERSQPKQYSSRSRKMLAKSADQTMGTQIKTDQRRNENEES